MNNTLWGIVQKLRDSSNVISDDEAIEVYDLCLRKMERSGNKPEWYMELLYEDELKNHLFRRAVNIVGQIVGGMQNVQCMLTRTM